MACYGLICLPLLHAYPHCAWVHKGMWMPSVSGNSADQACVLSGLPKSRKQLRVRLGVLETVTVKVLKLQARLYGLSYVASTPAAPVTPDEFNHGRITHQREGIDIR